MISNYFKALLISAVFTWPAAAEKISIHMLCEALSGHWQGSSANAGEAPEHSRVDAVCSGDQRQLFLSVTVSDHASESWWFSGKGKNIRLIMDNDKAEPIVRSFTLYRQDYGFSLLGQGRVTERPAMIRLVFERRQSGWRWLQQIQYLDDDRSDYRGVRGIEMLPVLP